MPTPLRVASFFAYTPVLRLESAKSNSYPSGGMAMKDEQLTTWTRRKMVAVSAMAVA
jgi:hypothetical protein